MMAIKALRVKNVREVTAILRICVLLLLWPLKASRAQKARRSISLFSSFDSVGVVIKLADTESELVRKFSLKSPKFSRKSELKREILETLQTTCVQ